MFVNKFRLFLTVFAALLLGFRISFAADPNAEAAANTIALINHINYVVETVNTYNNVIVLEQEYKNISVDNLNLNKIPDEDALKLITEILNTLNEMRMDERELKRAIKLLDRGLADKKLANMLDMVQRSTDAGMNAEGGLLKKLFAAGKAAISSKVESYVSYRKIQNELQNQLDDKKFDLETGKLKRLHELNVKLLESEWGLVAKYGLDDRLRVTGSNISRLVNCLKDSNRQRAYRRLLPMESTFEVYPTYWYYRTLLAVESNAQKDVINSARHFYNVNRGLFRRDSMAAAVAVADVCALVDSPMADKEHIKSKLKEICTYNDDSSDPEYGIFCAQVYLDFLNDPDSALKVLDPVKDAIEFSLEDQLVEYRDFYSKPQKPHSFDLPPSAADLTKCRMLRLAIDKKIKNTLDVKKLKEICQRDTTCSIEKLYYFGKLRVDDLWGYVLNDVCEIKLCWGKADNADEVLALVPMKWFLLGDMQASIDFMRGTNILSNMICVERMKRIETIHGDKGDASFVSLRFPVPKGAGCVDGLRLNLNHASFPVQLFYRPSVDFDIEAGTPIEGKIGGFAPVRVETFMGRGFGADNRMAWLTPPLYSAEEYVGKNWRTELGEEQAGDGDYAISRRVFSKLIFEEGTRVKINSHGLTELAVLSNSIVRVWYENKSTEEKTFDIKIVHRNTFGVWIAGTDPQRIIMLPSAAGYIDFPWPKSSTYLQECDKGVLGELLILKENSCEVGSSSVRIPDEDKKGAEKGLSPEQMPEFCQYIKNIFGTMNGDSCWVQPIPAKKLSKLSKELRLNEHDALVLYDGTLFGGAKEGFILTDKGLYFTTSPGGVLHRDEGGWGGAAVGCEWGDISEISVVDNIYLAVSGRVFSVKTNSESGIEAFFLFGRHTKNVCSLLNKILKYYKTGNAE